MTDKTSTSEAPAAPALVEPTPGELMLLMVELMSAQLRIAAQALESQAKLNDLVVEKLKNRL